MTMGRIDRISTVMDDRSPMVTGDRSCDGSGMSDAAMGQMTTVG